MKFPEADSMPAIALSALLVIGGIVALLVWALQVAYRVA